MRCLHQNTALKETTSPNVYASVCVDCGITLDLTDFKPENTIVKKEPEHIAADGTIRKDHYGAGRQPWDDIVDAGWGAQFAAGNALKYVRRYMAKNGEDDLEKGRWYFARLKELSQKESTILRDLLKILTPEEVELLGIQK